MIYLGALEELDNISEFYCISQTFVRIIKCGILYTIEISNETFKGPIMKHLKAHNEKMCLSNTLSAMNDAS